MLRKYSLNKFHNIYLIIKLIKAFLKMSFEIFQKIEKGIIDLDEADVILYIFFLQMNSTYKFYQEYRN